MRTILSLYLFFAILLSQFFAAYFLSKSKTSYRRVFSGMVLCISVYLFGYLMILNNSDLQVLVFWNLFQYFGLPFISVLWLTVALLYTKAVYPLKPWMYLLLFFVPSITFLMRLTNPLHHLFYTSFEIRELFGYYSLYMERDPWYHVNILYTILCLVLTVVIYFIGYLKNKAGFTRSHFLIFVSASLLPLLGIALILFAFEEQSIDYSALIMPLSLFIISYGILRHDFLEVRTLARETIFENNLDGMVILGPGKRIIDYNKAAKSFFKAKNISLSNYPIEHILREEPELLEIFESEDDRDFSLVINGEERFYEIDAVPLGDPCAGNTRMLKTIRDVTEERRTKEKLRYLATIDSLSGLYNRAEFMDLAQGAVDSARNDNEEIALLIMDLDSFKNINDTFGHTAGDTVIREVGSMIKASFRKTDIAGRLGGEEFAVVLKNASLNEAKTKAEQFREIVDKTKVICGDQEIGVTVSIGVAAVRGIADDIDDILDMLKMADDAMYKAKAKGKNCVAVYEPSSGNRRIKKVGKGVVRDVKGM